MINRAAVLVSPKSPYIEWARGVDDSDVTPDPKGERTVYLVPEYGTPDEAWAIIEEGFDEIFTRELEGWHTDESAWPQERSFSMFKEWFEIEFNSMIENLCGYELIDDAC